MRSKEKAGKREVAVRLLLVEDEAALARHLARGLREAGYAVDWAPSLGEANRLSAGAEHDGIVLDILLPDGSGLTLLRQLRAERLGIPVLLLTSRDRLEDKIEGLDAGADDYLTKPFAFEELLARLRSLLRRQPAYLPAVLELADLHLDRNGRSVVRAGRPVALTTREFAVLECLLLRAGRPVSRDFLAEHVWDDPDAVRSNVIDVIVNRMRRRLESHGEARLVHTLKGVGYVLRSGPAESEE